MSEETSKPAALHFGKAENAAPELGADGKPVEPTPDPLGQDFGAALVEAIAIAGRRRSGKEKPVPVPWNGYAEILGGGFWPGMHVLVAGTGTGKTTFALQIALGAAKAEHPVCYVGLELDETQVALRLLSEERKRGWSGLYIGKTTSDELHEATDDAKKLAKLPIHIQTGGPHGWAAADIIGMASALRAKYAGSPTPLIVVDFLQLVGNQPGERTDLRERIGRAAYTARAVAREHNVAVLVISSMARAHYQTDDLLKNAGLDTTRFSIENTDGLVGLGKEAGEIEYAADSVTVLAKWPDHKPAEGADRPFACIVPKLRYGRASWFPLGFTYRFKDWNGSLTKQQPSRDTEKPDPIADRL